jgi:hypothetical protein
MKTTRPLCPSPSTLVLWKMCLQPQEHTCPSASNGHVTIGVCTYLKYHQDIRGAGGQLEQAEGSSQQRCVTTVPTSWTFPYYGPSPPRQHLF